MENNKEEKKGKKTFWKTLGIVAVTVGICYEVFGRKGKDVKQACSWVKNKVSKKTTTEVETNPGRHENNNGGWNKQQRKN